MFVFTIPLLLFSNLFIPNINAEKESDRPVQTRRFDSEYSNCVCFPGGQSLIPEISNPEANGLERLVVYLYRTVDTKRIIAFTPNPKKQAIIPNIPFTSGDSIKEVTAKTIASLFNNETPGPSYNQGAPIGWNIGIIEENINPKPISTDSIKSFWKYPAQIPVQPSQYDRQLTYPEINGNSQQNLQPNYIEVNVPSTYDQVFNNGPDASIINNPWKPHKNSPEIVILQPNFSGLVGYEKDEHETIRSKPSPTFENWFRKQIVAFQDPALPKEIKTINFNVLRTLVEKKLRENRIYIGAGGILIDSTGTQTNLENLELRPILIGNPVKYKELRGNQLLTLPQSLPYSEGILITLIDPPKILAVIPIGKTYVSSSENIQESNTPVIKYYQTNSGLNYPWSYIEPKPKLIRTKIKSPYELPKENWFQSDAIESPKLSKLVLSPQTPELWKSRDNKKFQAFQVPNTYNPNETGSQIVINPLNDNNRDYRSPESSVNSKKVKQISSLTLKPLKGQSDRSNFNSLISPYLKPLDASSDNRNIKLVVSPIRSVEGSNANNALRLVPLNYPDSTAITLDNNSQSKVNQGLLLLPTNQNSESQSRPSELKLTPLNSKKDSNNNGNFYLNDGFVTNKQGLLLLPTNKNSKTQSRPSELVLAPLNSKIDSNNNGNFNSNDGLVTAVPLKSNINQGLLLLPTNQNSESQSRPSKLKLTPLNSKIDSNNNGIFYLNDGFVTNNQGLLLLPANKNSNNQSRPSELVLAPLNSKIDSHNYGNFYSNDGLVTTIPLKPDINKGLLFFPTNQNFESQSRPSELKLTPLNSKIDSNNNGNFYLNDGFVTNNQGLRLLPTNKNSKAQSRPSELFVTPLNSNNNGNFYSNDALVTAIPLRSDINQGLLLLPASKNYKPQSSTELKVAPLNSKLDGNNNGNFYSNDGLVTAVRLKSNSNQGLLLLPTNQNSESQRRPSELKLTPLNSNNNGNFYTNDKFVYKVPSPGFTTIPLNSNINQGLLLIPNNKYFKSKSSPSEFSDTSLNIGTDSNIMENSNANAASVYNPYNNVPVSITNPYYRQLSKNSELKKASITKSDSSDPESKKDSVKLSNSDNNRVSQNQNLLLDERGGLQNDNSEEETRRLGGSPSINGVLKSLIQMVITNFVTELGSSGRKSGNEKADVSDIHVNLNSNNPVKQVGEIEDGDQPDFRIIGGSAATGSGVPLSNKGRSGFNRG